jgi:hypothetical protein
MYFDSQGIRRFKENGTLTTRGSMGSTLTHTLVGPFPLTVKPTQDGIYAVIDSPAGWYSLYHYNTVYDQWHLLQRDGRHLANASSFMYDVARRTQTTVCWYGVQPPQAAVVSPRV